MRYFLQNCLSKAYVGDGALEQINRLFDRIINLFFRECAYEATITSKILEDSGLYSRNILNVLYSDASGVEMYVFLPVSAIT